MADDEVVPQVILHWDSMGAFHWAATEGVTVVCVDERTPGDRVYTSVGGIAPEAIEAVVSGAVPDLADASRITQPNTERRG